MLSIALDNRALLATVQRHQNPGGPILSNKGQKIYLIRPVNPFAIGMLQMCVRIAAPVAGEERLPSLGRTRRMGIYLRSVGCPGFPWCVSVMHQESVWDNSLN